MIGKDIFEDISIDAAEMEFNTRLRAKSLVDQWGEKLTENDLLRLNAMAHAEGTPENILGTYCLQYYKTQDYKPEFIHADMAGKVSTKRAWYKFW